MNDVDSVFRAAPTGSTIRARNERMDPRVRKTLQTLRRYLITLVRCSRTRDRALIDNLPAFVDGRHIHTFVLDPRALLYQIDALGADAIPMTTPTRDLVAALRSYLAGLEGVLVIEPPAFSVPHRRMDLRCVAFRPEVDAFANRITAVMAAE
jgi:hypothetical protein